MQTLVYFPLPSTQLPGHLVSVQQDQILPLQARLTNIPASSMILSTEHENSIIINNKVEGFTFACIKHS